MCKVTLSLGLLSPPPITSFQRYPQSKDIWLNLSMKCWNSPFNAQGSRLIIVVVQVGAVKIYVAAVEALRKKERQDETQFTTKIDAFFEFHPRLNAHVLFFCRFFWIPPWVWYDQTQGSRAVFFSSFLRITLLLSFCIFFWQCWCQSIASNLSCVTIFSLCCCPELLWS